MFSKRLICCAVLMAYSVCGFAATKAAHKTSAKTATKASGPKRLKGKTETLACRLGTEDRHARIAVVLIGGKTDSFAYYSKWKPRTCSIYLQRYRDSYSKWADNGNITTVDLERGTFLIEHKKGEYHFLFRDIDRERYCGMEGVINGGLTIRKGSDKCQLDGDIMVEGTPLGQAFANREEDKPPPGLMPDSVPAAAAEDTAAAPQPAAPAQAAAAVEPASATTAPKAVTPVIAKAAVEPAAEPEPAKAPTAPAQAAAATGATKGAGAEKSSETGSGNPFSTFFRSLATSRNPDEVAQPQAPGQ